jgi:hypothetical protein
MHEWRFTGQDSLSVIGKLATSNEFKIKHGYV